MSYFLQKHLIIPQKPQLIMFLQFIQTIFNHLLHQFTLLHLRILHHRHILLINLLHLHFLHLHFLLLLHIIHLLLPLLHFLELPHIILLEEILHFQKFHLQLIPLLRIVPHHLIFFF